MKKTHAAWLIGISVVLCCGGPISLVAWFVNESQKGHTRHRIELTATFDLSPNGREIVFPAGGYRDLDLLVYDISTQKVSPLVVSKVFAWRPRFSKDGSKVVYAGGVQGERGDHLFVYDRKTKHVEQLTKGDNNDSWPILYDDDKKVLFTREDASTYRWGGLSSSWNDAGPIHSLDLKTGKVSLLYLGSGSQRNTEIWGNRILVQDGRRDVENLHIYDIKTQKIVKTLPKTLRANFASDGRSVVAVVQEPSNRTTLVLVPMGEGNTRFVLKHQMDRIISPRLSPDGKHIFYLQATNNTICLYQIDLSGKNPKMLVDLTNFDRSSMK